MRRILSTNSIPIAVTLLGWLATASPALAYRYYVDNPQDYSTGGCGGDDRGDRTWPLRNALSALGWPGLWYTKGAAWPQDFIETSMGGGDQYEADLADLAVFDGHGNTGSLWYSHYHAGICQAGPGNIELGRLSGAKAANLITLSCCFMNLAHMENFTDHNGLNQQMGYGSLSSTDSNMVGNFWYYSGDYSGIFGQVVHGNNESAWLTAMEDRPSWFTGDNTVVVFTRGWDATDVTNNRSGCGLKKATCWSRKGYYYGIGSWYARWIDHGHDGCA